MYDQDEGKQEVRRQGTGSDYKPYRFANGMLANATSIFTAQNK